MDVPERPAPRRLGGRAPVRVGRLRATLLAVLIASAFGEGAAQAAEHQVSVSSNLFTPANLTVALGDTVRWTNTGGSHNVKFDDGSFEDPPMVSSSLWTTTRMFSSAGQFRYHCELHGGPGGMGMAGIVNVTAGPSSAPPGSPPPPGSAPPPALQPRKVTLALSDATARRGQRIRLFGAVRPQLDGGTVHIQKRGKGGAFRTVAKARLRDAGSARSIYSRRLRVLRDAVFRTRVAGDASYATGLSSARTVDVRVRRPRS
jgi:plastocyanin